MAHLINTATLKADLGTCYKYLYCIGRTWHILLIPLLYRQIIALPVITATV